MSRRKEPRRLRPDEEALWQQVARQTAPMHPDRRSERPAQPATPPRAGTTKAPARPHTDLSGFRIGGAAPQTAARHDLQPGLSDQLRAQPVRMDAKAFGRMKRGKLRVEARIDLHGLTLAEAHPRLNGFILDAHAVGKRLVLVITGKGRDRDTDGPMPMRRGALRHQVPQWLGQGALRNAVLQVTEAHRAHGGSGAFYVYLRRPGK